MGYALNKMRAANLKQKIKDRIDHHQNTSDVSSSIRETRHGYRGFGAFQLKKIYSSEGVHVVDIGGPPIVGR